MRLTTYPIRRLRLSRPLLVQVARHPSPPVINNTPLAMKPLNITTLVTMTLVWGALLYSAFIPTSRLNSMGLGSMPAYVVALGSLLAVIFAVSGLAMRKRMPKTIFIANQILCWSFPSLTLALL